MSRITLRDKGTGKIIPGNWHKVDFILAWNDLEMLDTLTDIFNTENANQTLQVLIRGIYTGRFRDGINLSKIPQDKLYDAIEKRNG